jgi:ribosomal-protein-alanine N-acetyltransferase
VSEDVQWLTVGPEGAALLAGLHHEAFAEAARDQWSENDFAKILALPTTIALIALVPTGKREKFPAGFVVFTQVLDESEILTLGVQPGRRKANIGHRLVRAVIERAHDAGVKSLFLEVREDNHAALHLYGRNGFVIAGRRKGYYQLNNGLRVDAVIMRRHII